MIRSNAIKKIRHFSINTLVWFLVVFVNFPLIWMILSSMKTREEVYEYPPVIISRNPTFASFIKLFETTNFERYLINSLIVTFSTIIIAIIIAVLATYALTRFKFKGAGLLSKLYILIYLLPQVVMIIPFFIVMNRLGIADSLIALVLTYLIFTFPYCYLMLRSYIGSISKSLEEAAIIDGCSRFGAFFRIILPIATPGIIATAIFSSVIAWNEYLFALVLIQNDLNRTLTVGIQNMYDQINLPDWSMMMAAGIIITLPMLIFFIIIQRRLVSGLAAGAVKE